MFCAVYILGQIFISLEIFYLTLIEATNGHNLEVWQLTTVSKRMIERWLNNDAIGSIQPSQNSHRIYAVQGVNPANMQLAFKLSKDRFQPVHLAVLHYNLTPNSLIYSSFRHRSLYTTYFDLFVVGEELQAPFYQSYIQ